MSVTDSSIHGSNVLDIVYTDGVPGIDDPAENYFQASKLYSAALPWDVPGVVALEQSAELREMAARSGRWYPSRPTVALPEPAPLTADLAQVLDSRRSAQGFGGGEVGLDVLAGVLRRTYGINRWQGHQGFRPTPSGGALYPLDLYVVARRVTGLRPGLYHFDPFRGVLADLGEIDLDAFDGCGNQAEMSGQAAFGLILSASFWRSRFKYGQRSLRFVLMESGHLAQNLLLVATGYGLPSRLIGGFDDDPLTALLPDHNGVDDAPVYVVLIGTPPAG